MHFCSCRCRYCRCFHASAIELADFGWTTFDLFVRSAATRRQQSFQSNLQSLNCYPQPAMLWIYAVHPDGFLGTLTCFYFFLEHVSPLSHIRSVFFWDLGDYLLLSLTTQSGGNQTSRFQTSGQINPRICWPRSCSCLVFQAWVMNALRLGVKLVKRQSLTMRLRKSGAWDGPMK